MDQDDRFKHLVSDPKFRRIPKTERKIIIDKRFQSMFKDEKFKIKYTVDKRGRPVNHNSAEDLKRYYELESEDESSSSSDEVEENDSDSETSKAVCHPNKTIKSKASKIKKSFDDLEEESSSSNDEEKNKDTGEIVRPPNKNELSTTIKTDKVVSNKIKNKLKNLSVDYARGEGTLISESSSDDDSESEEISDTELVDHGWGELDKDAERSDDITNRLAVCNQDWDRIRAIDLMVLFSSFIPPGGFIKSVTIYPSDFGLERLKEEDIKGPIELVGTKKKFDASDDEETEEGSKYHMEKLRQYQLNRLKYYYAIVVCDTLETANNIYTECDGIEYESSATKIDLRFVPDGTEFENTPKDVCEIMPEKYQPRFFTTTALQQAKVELTWDETNPDRAEVAKKLSSGNIDDVTEADLQAYLASSSGEESDEEPQEKAENSDSQEDDNKNPIDKYRALLNDIEKNEKEKENKDVEMEITWGLNVKEKTEKLVKKKLAENAQKTPFEQYLDKRKEKKKAKREERKLKQKESDASESEDSDIPSDIDMNDPYFAEEFNKPEFKKKKPSKNKTEEKSEQSEQEKAELELLLLNEDEDTRKHFNLKKIQDEENQSKKKKRKKKRLADTDEKEEDNFKLDVKDDRFSAIFSSHHFNIDPTDPHFKKTKAMEKLIEEKLKRRNENEDSTVSKKPKFEDKKDAELSVLVKNIKRKTKNFGAKK